MPKASHTVEVKASLERLWALLLDKIEQPQRYVPGVVKVEILDRQPGFTLRRMKTEAFTAVERITVFEKRHEIDFVLVDHPLYAGQVVNRIEQLYDSQQPGLPLNLTFALDWRRTDGQPDRLDMNDAIRAAVEQTKSLAEGA
ncbi:MAG: hypothetical protein Kilf2KO_45880 [Rhodospirillales bacterium]